MSQFNYFTSHEACTAITKKHAKSFYFASPVLPQAKRRAAFSIYAFCRFADDGVDLANSTQEKELHLKKCQDLLTRVYNHERGSFQGAFELAFEQTISRYEIPKKYFLDLLTGLSLDQDFKQPEDETELLRYCYYVAGTVGLIMTTIFQTSLAANLNEAAVGACALGDAMQLTNIARDIKEDANLGRCYLPKTWLREAGLLTSDILNLTQEQDLPRETMVKIWSVVERLITKADEQYAVARSHFPLLTADGSRFCVALMTVTYSGILKKLKKRGVHALDSRQRLSFFEKILTIPQAYGEAR